MDFIHLKTKTEFSISESINRIPDIVEKAKINGMGALGIADNNGMYGSVAFYKEVRKSGMKPIIGLDLTVEQEDGNTYQITLIAKNDAGYRKLIELNSKSYTENRTINTANAKEEWLADISDVVVLSGAKQGLVGQLIMAGKYDEAKEVAQQMKDFFGEDFYIELQRDGTKEEDQYMDGAVQICQDLDIAPVATHPNYFTEKEDFVAHEARYCISNKQPLFSMSRKRPFNKEMYFKTKEEMTDLFSDIPQSLENTVAIAKKCNISLSLDNPKLPNFPIPNLDYNVKDEKYIKDSTDKYFSEIALKGLEERLVEDFEDENERKSVRQKYLDRLNTEIGIINGMGFPGYFLIVSDFITWAKENDIPVGPGRGSGAGSLVAYAMKITDLDPLPYNLLFERFLNPDRVSMPDFDIDFCQARRNEVYEYVRQKYGTEAVCQIGTFGTMAAKAVVRDVGRTLGYPYDFVDSLAKMINIRANNPISLREFIFGDEAKGIPEDEKILTRYNNEQDVKKLIDIGLKLEGITRQVGTHAAGVVISPTTLTDFTPLYTASPGDSPSTQFDMSDVEKSGLVKFDFLGLRNLTIIKEAVDLVNKKMAKENKAEFNLKKIPLNDIEVYKNVFAKGNTVGIFQFEGKGMTAVLQKANPSKLEDLIAINALYRPGPMEIIPDWLSAKNLPENEVEYPDERLRGVLQETYGFMIYQEQVMQCAQIIAGYSLGGADLLRRAMGKKKPEEMAKQRAVFIEGAGKNNVSEEKASHLFDLIEKFSGYGFNKSHAAAYSYIAYQTAYLKTHHTEEFLTANLNSHIDSTNTDKISVLVEDAKNNNIKINQPDINKSSYRFTIENTGEIRYGLGALKGVGDKAVQTIVDDRNMNGEYTDFYNFLERVGKGTVNKRVLEALIKSGAFDSINTNRAQLQESIAEGLDYVAKFRKSKTDNIAVLGNSLFDDEDAPVEPVKSKRKKKVVEVIKPELKEVSNWDDLTSAKNEKNVLGFFFSSNPFNTYYAKQLDGMKAAIRLSQIEDHHAEGNTEAFIGCIVENIKWWGSKKGAFVTISDGSSTVEVSMFEDFLNTNKDWLREDSFVSLRLKLQTQYNEKENSEDLRMTVQQGFGFEETKRLLVNKIFIASKDDPDLISKYEKIINNYIGSPEDNDPVVTMYLPDADGKFTKAQRKYSVKPDSKMFDEFVQTFGTDFVKYNFKSSVDNIQFPELAYKNKSKYNNKKKSAFSN